VSVVTLPLGTTFSPDSPSSHSNNLGKDATIMLALINGDLKGLYEDFFPIVWK
jgi:hypothetical protein